NVETGITYSASPRTYQETTMRHSIPALDVAFGASRAALLVGFLSLTGCTASPPDASDAPAVRVDAGGVPIPPSHAGPPRLLKPSELSEAEKRFGISPERTPGLTYQPDVVLLRAGVN